MALKDLLKATTYDRYTQDGRDKLNEALAEDVTYKTGDISQKTGLQKQPDGSWAPPKKGGKPGAKAESNATEGLEGKSTEELTNLFNELATKSVREKSPENSAARDRVYKELKRRQKAESNPTDKYKDLPGAQKKDALFASTFEGISIGQTQTSMERNGWDLVQADDDVNVYAKPDGSKVTMKHDGKRITETNYEAPKSDAEVGLHEGEENQTKAKFDEYGLPSNETIAMKDKFLEEEKIEDPTKLTNEEFRKLATKINDKLKIGNFELAEELLVATKGKEDLQKERRNAEVGLHEGEEDMPEFVKSYKLLSEEHDQDVLESNAKIYPTLQPLAKQRASFVQKRIAAYTKLKDNPNNPQARADFVDASNTINQIDADVKRAYQKATAGDSAPRELTGDTKIRLRAATKDCGPRKLTGDCKIRVRRS